MKKWLFSRYFIGNIIAGLCCCLWVPEAMAQVPYSRYNRFQYHSFHWQSFHTKEYTIYFPEGYDSLCKFATNHLPAIIKTVGKTTGLSVQAAPNIIIYPSVPQLYETNIGLYDSIAATFPTIELKGDRVLLAYTGSYEQFLVQLKAAWLRACWESRFSAGLESQLSGQPPVCPDWFREAFISYMAGGWQLEDEAGLHRKMLLTGPENWNAFSGMDSLMAGRAFCYFLCVHYRGDAMLQLLFQFKQQKTLARALRLIFKHNIDYLEDQCFAFYQKRYSGILSQEGIYNDAQIIRGRLWPGEKLISTCPNLSQQQTAFVIEKAHQRTVYLVNNMDTLMRHRRKIATCNLPPWYYHHQADAYPIVTWGKDKETLFIIAPEKGIINIKAYSTRGALMLQKKLYGVDGVSAFIEQDNGDWLLSAYRRGQGDIVMYHPRQGDYTPWTNDKADDDLLYYDPEENEYRYRSGFPADSLGGDSTGKPYGIYTIHNGKEQLVKADSRYERYRTGQQDYSSIYTRWLNEQQAIEKTRDSIAGLEQQLKENDINISSTILGYADGSSRSNKNRNKRQSARERKKHIRDSLYAAPVFNEDKVKPNSLQLFRSWYTAQVNNDYFINRLQPYKGYLGTFKFPEVGAMIASGFSDLFENYHFNIGYKMPAGTEGSDFFIRFENTKRSIDWHLMYYRKVESLQPDAIGDWKDALGNPYPTLAKVKTYYFEAGIHYPFSYNWGLDITPAFRKGRTIFLSTDKYSLDFGDLKDWWNINTLTLTGQQLQPTIPMLYKGWNIKLLGDIIASYGKNAKFSYGLNAQMEYHQPLIKYITLVARLKAGYSGGDHHILYDFGGTDNNIVPRVDTAVHFGQNAPYIFQELVGGLRGYEQNSLYGNAYGMLQADVYFPVFNTLIPLNTGFSSIHNLQLGVFADMAYAKETWNPVDKDWNHKIAFGCSARTLLAGYPIRFDIAWPEHFNQKPVWYLSLTL